MSKEVNKQGWVLVQGGIGTEREPLSSGWRIELEGTDSRRGGAVPRAFGILALRRTLLVSNEASLLSSDILSLLERLLIFPEDFLKSINSLRPAVVLHRLLSAFLISSVCLENDSH